MSDIATITISGRLTRDGELKSTNSGSTVLKFSVACNRWKNGASKTSFYDCELWGKYGEAKAKIATKGTHVIVSGTLDIDEYDGENGKVKKPVVTVSMLEPSPNQNTQEDAGFSRPSQPARTPPQKRSGGPEDFEDDIPFGTPKKFERFDDEIPF